MKVLITGIKGFVGKHLEEYLKDKADVFGTSRADYPEKNIFKISFLSEWEIIRLMEKINPTHVFHLAGFSSVKDSWENKQAVIAGNVTGTIHLLEAVRKVDDKIRIITVGSSEEYGIVPDGIEKVHEGIPLSPVNPYGVSKSMVSMLAKMYFKFYGLNVIHARSFNHIGSGQRLGFVTTDFAHQIAVINKRNTKDNTMNVGNLDTIRDFAAVEDIADAYYHLGRYGKAGEIYNVCTGEGASIRDILNILLSFSKVNIEVMVDPEKIRTSEIQKLVGDPNKIIKDTNWRPKRQLEQTLKNIYEQWLYNL
ncbi:GDP-mannose 4,6-dehydratase [Bacillus canaveralius]|uniref:GDP-mannose 4,6-dehydratase n=1 Tax=Bacillus canaveralius TaxID=1403243 RepID=UPI000F79DFBB|nr:GDP-mannose 4,6-dehydratase [Bacillus canaveralius]RSK52912.1 NAD-dependent epimerase/dehydratase family protein [Bacillus canaveralius]